MARPRARLLPVRPLRDHGQLPPAGSRPPGHPGRPGAHRRAKLDRIEIRRYSDLYFETHSREESDRANRERAVPIRTNDYDFSADWHGRSLREPDALEALTADYERFVSRMPTFQVEYRAGTFEKHYLPARVMVLS